MGQKARPRPPFFALLSCPCNGSGRACNEALVRIRGAGCECVPPETTALPAGESRGRGPGDVDAQVRTGPTRATAQKQWELGSHSSCRDSGGRQADRKASLGFLPERARRAAQVGHPFLNAAPLIGRDVTTCMYVSVLSSCLFNGLFVCAVRKRTCDYSTCACLISSEGSTGARRSSSRRAAISTLRCRTSAGFPSHLAFVLFHGRGRE